MINYRDEQKGDILMVDGMLTWKFLFSLVITGILLSGAIKLVLINNRFGKLALTLVLLIGGYFLFDQTRSTTFEKAVLMDSIQEDSEIKQITIQKVESGTSLNDKIIDKIIIEDKEFILEILNVFLGMDLHKEFSKSRDNEKYRLSFLVSTRKENKIVTDYYSFFVGEEYLNDYKIVREKNHLNTLEELLEREDLGWEDES